MFRQLVLARIIEPSSKLDAARVLEEIGIQPCSYPTLKRRLPVYARPSWRQALAAACAAHAGLSAASLVLFDVSTLYTSKPRAWHRHFPPSDGPRGPEEAPDLAHHQEWTIGMQRAKL